MERTGHTSPQVALRYQHVMAGRDQAIAATLPTEPPAATYWHASGTNRACEVRGSRPPRSWWALTWHVGGRDGRI
jgi:hypothetical protein